MKGRPAIWAILAMGAALLWLASAGCNKGTSDNAGGASSGGSPPSGDASASKYDGGPRANATPVDEEKAEKGATLFASKGCTACHAFGKRISGPDLAGVTSRRSAEWLSQWLRHPDTMTKEDPIARQLFGQYALQMPNLALTEDDARALVEYFKKQDAGESGAKTASQNEGGR